MKILKRLTKNRREIVFNKNTKEFIVCHHTGSGNSTWQQILKFFKRSDYLSVHYIIGKDGTIIQYVDDDDVAYHAGRSRWGARSDLNWCSIGIEVVSNGHDYTNEQRNALMELCKELMAKYNINANNVLRHADISGFRGKWDIGPAFYQEQWGSWTKFQAHLENLPKTSFAKTKELAIECVKKNKISNGERPDDLITRVELFIIIMRLFLLIEKEMGFIKK